MLAYEFRDRIIQFDEEVTPAFPAHAKISAALAPGPPFGGQIGNTRTTAKGISMRARSSPSTGRFFFELDEPLFEHLSASCQTDIGLFSIHGHVVSVESIVESMQDLANLLGSLCYHFPATLNLAIPDGPYVLYSFGEVDGNKFQWHFHPKELHASLKVTSKESLEQDVVKAWSRVSLVRPNSGMFISLHYFRVARRLLVTGNNRFEFMAEVVLNLAKSLQSLGGESLDEVRVMLSQLGVSNKEAEALYIPAMVLRSYFDVAHVNFTEYSNEQLRILNSYVDMAEDAFNRLLKTALEQYESGNFTPKVSRSKGCSSKEAKIIRQLKENLLPFENTDSNETVWLDENGATHSAFNASRVIEKKRSPPRA